MEPEKMNTSRRPRKRVQCEIVSVDCPTFLVNSKRLACRYETDSGEALAAGYYLLVWAGDASRSFYGPKLRHFGPFETSAIARLFEISAAWLGIVDPILDSAETAPLEQVKSTHQHGPHALADQRHDLPRDTPSDQVAALDGVPTTRYQSHLAKPSSRLPIMGYS